MFFATDIAMRIAHFAEHLRTLTGTCANCGKYQTCLFLIEPFREHCVLNFRFETNKYYIYKAKVSCITILRTCQQDVFALLVPSCCLVDKSRTSCYHLVLKVDL